MPSTDTPIAPWTFCNTTVSQEEADARLDYHTDLNCQLSIDDDQPVECTSSVCRLCNFGKAATLYLSTWASRSAR